MRPVMARGRDALGVCDGRALWRARAFHSRKPGLEDVLRGTMALGGLVESRSAAGCSPLQLALLMCAPSLAHGPNRRQLSALLNLFRAGEPTPESFNLPTDRFPNFQLSLVH